MVDFKVPEEWPVGGQIEFKNYSTRYREGLDLVLKVISKNDLSGFEHFSFSKRKGWNCWKNWRREIKVFLLLLKI